MLNNQHRRGAQGKYAAASALQRVQKVRELFRVNAVVELLVTNYYQLPEREKRSLCDTLMDVTICKIAARTGEGMYFYLRKEGCA